VFMEHEGGLFLFAEQTIVLQTIVLPMYMIIMGISVNIECVVYPLLSHVHIHPRAVEISSSMALHGPSKPLACPAGHTPTFLDYLLS
jgi:hypothetical protein